MEQGAALIDAAEADRIRAAVADLCAVRNGVDADGIRAVTDRVNHETRHLAELLMDAVLRETLRNRQVVEPARKQ